MEIPIVFENKNLLIINKPVGLIVHGDGKTDQATVVDWIMQNRPELRGVGENMTINHKGQEVEIQRPGIVHRIDKETSGLLVIAKTQDSFEHLKELFKTKQMEKSYQALLYGYVKNDQGRIDEPIGRSSKDFRMKMAGPYARGKLREAQTEYRVVQRYVDLDSKKDVQGQHKKYTLIECLPKTGRTHQIRVHMKWLNHPLVSDSLYQGKRKNALGLDRTGLHAQGIIFSDIDGNLVDVSIGLPIDMKKALDSLSPAESNL